MSIRRFVPLALVTALTACGGGGGGGGGGSNSGAGGGNGSGGPAEHPAITSPFR